MLCDVCKKNEASVHLTQIIDSKMQTVDLCEECSKAKGVDDPTGFSLVGLLKGLAAAPQESETRSDDSDLTKCPKCGFSIADFKKTGRLGCAFCYSVFAEPLEPLLKSMHKGLKHTGKVPHGLREVQDMNERLRKLQQQLQEAIKVENFEEAAFLRDEIKKTRDQMTQNVAG
jgi:protein arginine kinase activator